MTYSGTGGLADLVVLLVTVIATDCVHCSGLCSALSPAELRAAEAAERLLEQERKDLEIARRLQVVQCLSSH